MVRAKFVVNSIELYQSPKGSGCVKLNPVYKTTPGVSGNACEENQIFGQYTPSGSVMLSIHNPAALEQFKTAFENNTPFYVDFTPAPE